MRPKVLAIINFQIIFDLCFAMQSYVNREYRRGLRMHSPGTPLLSVSVEDNAVALVRKSRI